MRRLMSSSDFSDGGGDGFSQMGQQAGDDGKLLERITVVPGIFGGKPVIRGRRLAVEHVLRMLAAGDDVETILDGYPWLEAEDIQACLIYSRSVDDDVEPEYEWRIDVEPNYEWRDDVEPNYEWRDDVEPNYDSEEEERWAMSAASRRW